MWLSVECVNLRQYLKEILYRNEKTLFSEFSDISREILQ